VGSKSKSSTASTNTTKDFVTNNVDNRVGEGDIGGNINLTLSDITANKSSSGSKGVGVGGGDGGVGGVNVDIMTSDFGALDTASDLSDRAFAFSENVASSLSAGSTNAINKAIEVAQGATQDEGARTNQLLIIAVGGVAAVVLMGVIFKGRK